MKESHFIRDLKVKTATIIVPNWKPQIWYPFLIQCSTNSRLIAQSSGLQESILENNCIPNFQGKITKLNTFARDLIKVAKNAPSISINQTRLLQKYEEFLQNKFITKSLRFKKEKIIAFIYHMLLTGQGGSIKAFKGALLLKASLENENIESNLTITTAKSQARDPLSVNELSKFWEYIFQKE